MILPPPWNFSLSASSELLASMSSVSLRYCGGWIPGLLCLLPKLLSLWLFLESLDFLFEPKLALLFIFRLPGLYLEGARILSSLISSLIPILDCVKVNSSSMIWLLNFAAKRLAASSLPIFAFFFLFSWSRLVWLVDSLFWITTCLFLCSNWFGPNCPAEINS